VKYIHWFACFIGYYMIASTLWTAYQTVPGMVKKRFAQPKFSVGDCIRSYGQFDSKIVKIFPARGINGPGYGYTIGLNCHDAPDYFDCSQSDADVDIVNENSVKIDCPAEPKRK